MVKNTTGGNKAKSISRSKVENRKNKLFKKPCYHLGDIIGKISKGLGNGRFDVKCFADGIVQDINCSAPRKIRVFINDLVVINILRDNRATHSGLGCIIHKYESEHYADLKIYDLDYIKVNKLNRPDIIKILKHEKQDAISELFDEGACAEGLVGVRGDLGVGAGAGAGAVADVRMSIDIDSDIGIDDI